MAHDDFQIEPIVGLPETPPEGEVILWQGRPDTWALAREALNVNWVAAYFVILAVWRVASVSDLMPFSQALSSAVPFLLLGAGGYLLLLGLAWVQARCTMYTITSARVVMRIGAALTLTLNLPFRQISNAALDLRASGTGTIALETTGNTKLSYLVLWPHARPWRFGATQPALRCVPDAQNVARILAEAAEDKIATPQIVRAAPTGAVPAE